MAMEGSAADAPEWLAWDEDEPETVRTVRQWEAVFVAEKYMELAFTRDCDVTRMVVCVARNDGSAPVRYEVFVHTDVRYHAVRLDK